VHFNKNAIMSIGVREVADATVATARKTIKPISVTKSKIA